MFCRKCGTEVDTTQALCPNCGADTGNTIGGKDKLTIVLFCYFLGAFGVHNFMMGETKKGIIKIVATCCCLLGGILAVIDLIKIAADRYTVDPEAFI